MLEALARDAIARAAAHVPGLARASGVVQRSIKCVVVPATLDGAPAIVKALVKTGAPWAHYIRRERALYRTTFTREAPPIAPVRMPRLLAETPEESDVLVLERLPGAPLARRRHDEPPHDRATWEKLLALRRALRGWERGLALAPTSPPDAATRKAMRARLLEDPSAPVDWIADGVRLLAARESLEPAAASAIVAALEAHPVVAFAHGDLLLRNVLRDDDTLSLVDWECAGAHHDAWDAALLWPWAPSWARDALREEHARESKASERALLACVAFALTRELWFRRRTPSPDRAVERLRVERARIFHEMPPSGSSLE